jgi:hypothetical protein
MTGAITLVSLLIYATAMLVACRVLGLRPPDPPPVLADLG